MVPYVNRDTKLNVADVHTKSVTTDVIRNLLSRLCGYEVQWMHGLLMNASGYTTPIKPTSKHIMIMMVITAYARRGYTPPTTRTLTDMKQVIASFGEVVYTHDNSEFQAVDDNQLHIA